MEHNNVGSLVAEKNGNVKGFDTTLGIVTLDGLIGRVGDPMSEIGKIISEELPQGNA
jgi:hypothetical protein